MRKLIACSLITFSTYLTGCFTTRDAYFKKQNQSLENKIEFDSKISRKNVELLNNEISKPRIKLSLKQNYLKQKRSEYIEGFGFVTKEEIYGSDTFLRSLFQEENPPINISFRNKIRLYESMLHEKYAYQVPVLGEISQYSLDAYLRFPKKLQNFFKQKWKNFTNLSFKNNEEKKYEQINSQKQTTTSNKPPKNILENIFFDIDLKIAYKINSSNLLKGTSKDRTKLLAFITFPNKASRITLTYENNDGQNIYGLSFQFEKNF